MAGPLPPPPSYPPTHLGQACLQDIWLEDAIIADSNKRQYKPAEGVQVLAWWVASLPPYSMMCGEWTPHRLGEWPVSMTLPLPPHPSGI